MQILSIQSQVRTLREFAARSGLTITHELTESYSARRPGRPVFSKLLKDVEARRVERILAWRLDRLARNSVDGGQLIYQLGEGALKELVTPEGTYSGGSDSKFMLSVLFGAATKMTDDLSAGVRRGNQDLLKSGRIPGCPPLGYLKVRDKPGFRGAGKVVPDPERFPILERAWREVASGTATVAEVWRRAVHEWGLRSRETRGSARREPTVTTFYHLFSNPFYAGRIQYGGETFIGEHVPMVAWEDFERVQRLVKPEGTPRPSRHQFLYRGILRCGHCERLLVGERIVKRSGLGFTYYRCGRRRQGYDRCPALAPTEKAVTDSIDCHLQGLIVPPPIVAWTRSALDWYAEEQHRSSLGREEALHRELGAADKDLRRLTDVLLRGLIGDDEFVARRDAIQARIASLRHQLEDPEAEVAEWRGRVDQVLDASNRVAEILKSTVPDARRSLLGQLYENLWVRDRITKPSLRFPFTVLEHATDLGVLLPAGDENHLPPPSTVLNERKNARRRSPPERALNAWCTKLEEVRTLGAPTGQSDHPSQSCSDGLAA